MCNVFRNLCRTDFLSASILILVFIIKETAVWNDFNNRKRFSFNNSDSKFPPLDIFLNNQFIFIAERSFDSLVIFFFGVYDIYTNAGTAGAWFYNDWE